MNIDYDGARTMAFLMNEISPSSSLRFVGYPPNIRRKFYNLIKAKRYKAKKAWQRGSVRG